MCPTTGATGYQNVEVGGQGAVFFPISIVDFHEVVGDDRDVTDIQAVGIQDTVEGSGVVECLDLDLVETLPELAPHGIEHHFGQLPQTRIVLDLVVLQVDAFVLIVLADVLLTFGLVVAYPFGPTAGFLLDFQPVVEVVLEETLKGFWEMPHLVDVLDFVAQLDGFLQFGGAPRPGQGSFVFGVCAQVGSLQGRFLHFFLHASDTERKGEFACMMVREYGMV